MSPRPRHPSASPTRPLVLGVFAVAALVLGPCGAGGTARCRELVKHGRFDEAVAVCERAWAVSHDGLAGAGVATALSSKNDFDGVMIWADRLAGTPHEPEVLVAVGWVRQRKRMEAGARAAFERAITLGRRFGDHESAALAAYELFQSALKATHYVDALSALDTAEKERKAAGLVALRRPILTGLFEVLVEIGDIEAGRRVLAAAAAEVDPANPDEMRTIRARQAVLQGAEGSWALQRQAYEETLALNARSRVPRPSLTWTTTLNLIELAIARNDLEEARRRLDEATVLFRKHYQPGGNAEIALLRRRALFEKAGGHRDEARRLVAAAQALHPADEVAWELATEEGELAEEAGEWDAAERAYAAAISVLDRMNAGLFGGDLQLWSLAKKRQPFARLFSLHVRRGRIDRAFAVWDRLSRRAFVQGFLRATRSTDLSPDAASQQALSRLEFLTAILPNLNDSPVVARAATECGAPPPWVSGLFYFEGVDELYVLVVRAGAVSVRVAGRLDEISALVARFVAAPDDRELGAALGRLLVPILPVASADEVLYVSPARALAELPFAALRVGGRRLVDHATLAMIPGLGVLERPDLPTPGPPLVLADPQADLPEARVEGEETAAMLGIRPLLGELATPRRLEEAPSPRLLHLATHSGLGPAGPWLQLHQGPLVAKEILDLGLRARTVVLPTCSSAVGTAPGVSPSLAASFLAGGARTVVGALRSIEDGAARRFIHDFYAAGGADDPARAVARVQRRWSRDRPAVEWAPFVVLGGSPPASVRPTDRVCPSLVTERPERRLMGRSPVDKGGRMK